MSKAPAGVDQAELTVVARNVLLDGLTALSDHLDAVTVVGAQAVYLRTQGSRLATAAYTSDGDLGLDPAVLGSEPLIQQRLREAGFELLDGNQPGLWVRELVFPGIDTPVAVELDLLVGATVAGKGSRSADLKPHDKMTARRVPGLETALVDRSPMEITALDGTDRSIHVHVAGPVALLVAKAHKIHDRLDDAATKPNRLTNKDAGDVYRLMTEIDARVTAESFARLLADPRVGEVTATGLKYLREQFGGLDTPGVRLAVEALAGDVPADRVARVSRAYVTALRHLP
ncbi:hypothetical protein [Umezawaea tangerina]|uniref:Nucleotidyltransferase-like protein n=1 Tax=Umezawaea tangerina TaxID=84725 RepID=A0A2T0T9M4_9PSEU|nr:hypothetical protein [Umezawaea tangerina]PRY42362.1 hypothetical protein CLV43_104193 [Umezawaea tangerina]